VDRFWKTTKKVLFALTLGALLCMSGANAQTPAESGVTSPQPKEGSSDSGLHVDIAPYLWFSGMHGTVGVRNQEASVHAGFGDIFNYLNMGLMGAAEVRYNRVIMPVDFIWMKLSDDKALPFGQQATTVKAKMTETLLTPKIGYRIADGERVKVDALFGVRYWHLSTDLTLQRNQVLGTLSDSGNWVDAIAGGRITAELAPKTFITIAGDAGGGSARSDYQVGGFLGYQISRKCVLQAGYRYLSVNYRPNSTSNFVYDLNMPGLLVGATINLK
jgi:hypothetical protein